MGLATNITLFLLCVSFVFYLFGYGTIFTNFVGCVQSDSHVLLKNETCNMGVSGINLNMFNSVSGAMTAIGIGVGGIAAVLALTTFGATAVFSIVGLLLFGLVTFPIDLFSQPFVPFEIKLFFGAIYGFGYMIALISWLKIGGTP